MAKQRVMAKFNDDVILEIVARLPLKYAKQCSVLNKNIHRCISHNPNFSPHYSTTIFHCSINFPNIFTSIWQAIRSATVHPLRKSVVTLDMAVSIKASCNGLLFLSLNRAYYVFNPTTAAIISVADCRIDSYTSVGLAVPNNSRFKLVAVQEMWNPAHYFAFTVFLPSGDSMLSKSQFSFYCGREHNITTDQPVYAHGSLYWLANCGKTMVALDVEAEVVSLIIGPAKRIEANGWFGFASGSIHFVYASSSEIVICCYDHINVEVGWRVKHRISNVCRPRSSAPLFFNGRHLLFLAGKSRKGRKKSRKGGDVCRYDLVRDLWENVDSWTDCEQVFFSYTSSFAEVSNTYLDEKNTSLWAKEDRRNALLGLQKLLKHVEMPIQQGRPKRKRC